MTKGRGRDQWSQAVRSIARPEQTKAGATKPKKIEQRKPLRCGLKEVSATACAVADVVADQIGNDGWIAVVVFWNAGLDFADKVSAHVGGLGKNAAAQLSKERDEARAEGAHVLNKPLKPASLRALIAQWRVQRVAAE